MSNQTDEVRRCEERLRTAQNNKAPSAEIEKLKEALAKANAAVEDARRGQAKFPFS